MALLNPTFVLGIIVLLYLSSFVIFAILRIVTGISVQRIGYLSLRRLAYTPRDGFTIQVRGLGFSIHRPTFAHPTWLSLVLSELVVTIDVEELEGQKKRTSANTETGRNESEGSSDSPESTPTVQTPLRADSTETRSKTWKTLTKIKERIKKLHRRIEWLRMVDIIATNSTVNVVGVGNLQIGNFTLSVDTRRKMVDRARFFFQRSEARKQKRQAEWNMTMRSILFTVDGKESLEVLDHALLNVHGFLYEGRDGLRDATIALKLGRAHIPVDDLQFCAEQYKRRQRSKSPVDEPLDIYLGRMVQELDSPGTTSENLMRTVSDSRDFFSSILRGIKEVQFAVSYIGLTKKVASIRPASAPLLLSAQMKEVGIDLHRLDPRSPSHRMYFPAKDIAHEALAAALSISVGLDDGHGKPDRLLYIPMATTTVRTTLPSKTVEQSEGGGSLEERNTNILFANSVVTSPSLDLEPRHLPILIALVQSKRKAPKAQQDKRRELIPRLLPKANVKMTMHEPVVRIKLSPLEKSDNPFEYDLLISSISSISADIESSHSLVSHSHYSLNGAVRIQSHYLYYQSNIGERFNLLTTDSSDMKLSLMASPDVSVEATGNIQSFSVSMVRPEIADGLRQIVQELRIDVEPEKKAVAKAIKQKNFLRSLPRWLSRCQIEVTDFNFEVAGVDEDISGDARGISLHMDTLAAEYREQKGEGSLKRSARPRAHSRTITQSDSDLTPSPDSPRPKRKIQNMGDGRRLSISARGIDTHMIERADFVEADPFLRVPRLELIFTALSDGHGPLFHVQAAVRSIFAHYSLYRHYAVGVAAMTLRKAFMKTGKDAGPAKPLSRFATGHLLPPSTDAGENLSTIAQELMTLDIKATLVQIKASMPHEPAMMIHVYGLETGKHRWSAPYFTSKLIRLYAEPPRMRHVWARLISIKTARVDLRKSKRKTARGGTVEEKMIDISSEAMRIAVPHEVIVNRITDNVINVAKAVQQLHHRFKTGTNEYILEKHPEGPKNVPKVSLRTRNFLFELEDGAFEWKLGMIYRTGRIEQMQRLAREEAFQAKLKRVRDEEIRRGGGKARSRSAYQRGRTEQPSASWFRSRSLDVAAPSAAANGPGRSRIPRYDPEGETMGINSHSRVSEEEARRHLDVYNAQTWRNRIDRAYQLSSDSTKELRRMFWGSNPVPEDVEETENILEVPERPALMSTMISDLHFVIDKPSFPMSELPQFLHKVGKGLPKDTKYSLLVPMHVAIEMDEVRVSLRDYPLPLLHIPAMKTGQSNRVTSVSLKTDFVLAEEFRGAESTRRIRVNVVPPKSADPSASKEGSFSIEVRRTVGPVKSYTDAYMDINTALPTRITWGPCYQPAIQDMMMAIESFTKPQIDPSERVGFWDKLRLVFHSRIHVAWKGDGDMHLALKGTRDPYQVTGNGAGFLMCWRNNVKWNINAEDDPKRFMTVDSGEYVLAIPDYSHQVREAARRQSGDENLLTDDSIRSGAQFKKVVMKLSGKVQWMAGLIFERAIEDGKRSFEFKPHYEVILKNPDFAKPVDGLPYDSMRGFRSRHIHLSIAIRAPVDRDWMGHDPGQSRSYNSIHLTPRFFTHFFTWWGLFGQPMSLPIRQGSLFPGREKNSKKFGRHLATVKYNLLLAPLFLSHIYKHKDAEDYSDSAVSATGLKVRFDSFMLDIHQRREEFNTLGRGRNAQSRTSGVKIHAAQLDLVNADLRAVSASLKGTTTEAIKKGTISTLVTDQDERPDLSRFTIPDKDYSWIDMDDFVELDWILPTEPHPHTKILPLAYAPRLTYFRQTDIGGTISGDPTRTSPFGNEPTHFCIMSHDDDPKRVQAQLIERRLEQLSGQMQSHARNVGEAELKVIKTNSDADAVEDFDELKKHSSVLREKQAFLESMLEQVYSKTPPDLPHGESSTSDESIKVQDETLNIPATAEFESEFNNRFVVHNMQLKWNNLLRNIVLRYFHQNSQRRGFIYYLSRPAVKFILDIVEEQSKAKSSKPPKSRSASAQGGQSPSRASTSSERNNTEDIEERIKNILGESRKFRGTNFTTNENGATSGTIEDLVYGISDEFSAQSSYHIRLIAPQIQLQSEKNTKHVVLVTSKGMELKVMEVMDKERMSDTVSGLVQRRFLVNMDSTQFFVTHHKWFMTNIVSMYAGSRYGTVPGSAWPPWVPMEVMFDFNAAPFGFKRVVQKTSAMLRYDKYNTLRLKYNDEVNTEDCSKSATDNSETRMDSLWVEFPQARALCNSSQYYAMYVIVLDLLMYSEPLEKTRSERLEKIMLASDFSDLSGAPAKIQKLQERVRQMEEIKNHFQIYSMYLDKRGWEDRLTLERDLAIAEDELFFVMKAITTSQRKYDTHSENNALLKWNISAREIVWHLMQDSNEPLVELQLKDMEYDRTDNSDGSHMNLIRVGKVLGLNLLPDATYPEIIAPYTDAEKETLDSNPNQEMIRVYWYMLEAIAGIPVMDRFEVNLFPMKIQLEREVGKRMFEYIFPGMNGEKFPGAGARHDSHMALKQSMTAEVEEDDQDSIHSASSRVGTPSMDKDSSGFSTRAGSLELRLRPTLTSNMTPERSSKKSLSVHSTDGNHFRLFRGAGHKSVHKKSSYDSLRVLTPSRPGGVGRSSTGASSKESRETAVSESKKRFGLRGRTQTEEKSQQDDDLTKMITRASNYMTFAYIKMPSVVLCLSYKGKDQRNFEDVHDFVFRLPTIEWQNKTWSNLDLALALKKAVVKALISHTGAIIGNKFSKHRPNAEQRNKLRELASSSVMMMPSSSAGSQNYAGSVYDSDDSSSLYGQSPVDFSRSPPRSLRGSTHGSISGQGQRSTSRSSSVASSKSRRVPQISTGNIPLVPAFLTMTPPTPIDGRGDDSLGLGIDIPLKTSDTGLSSSSRRSHRISVGERPGTSSSFSEVKDRRKSATVGLRDRISALTHRMSHRESSGLAGAHEEADDSGEEHEEDGKEDRPSTGKRLSWAPGRIKTG